MIQKIGGRIARVGNRINTIQDIRDIVLTFRVRGSYFPARRIPTAAAFFYVYSKANVDNVIYIDYKDGTGEHAYPFRTSGSNKRFQFYAMGNATTPETICGDAQGYAATKALYPPYGLHFYQDLPVGVKNTVNDNYAQYRDITVRFEKPQAITYMMFRDVVITGELSAGLSKMESLETLSIASALNITLFPQDFYSSRVKILTMSNVGKVFDAGWPQWILNSPLENVNVLSSMNLSGTAISKGFDKIHRLKETLKILNISDTKIDYKLPEEFGELYKLESLTMGDLPNTAVRFPDDISGLAALNTLVVNSTRMPFTEVERVLQGLPALKSLTLNNCNYTNDYTIAADNNLLETILIGNQSWNGGAIPSFIDKLIALKTLNINSGGASLNTSFTGWGTFPACVNLVTISLQRVTTMPTTLPAWMANLVKLKTLNAAAVYTTTARVNAFVDSFYNLVTGTAPKTGTSANTFRSMNIDIYGTSTVDIASSVRPSGAYQQPAGYIAGSNNGAPASQMEKIWVLTNQYAHVWTVKP